MSQHVLCSNVLFGSCSRMIEYIFLGENQTKQNIFVRKRIWAGAFVDGRGRGDGE